MEPRVREDDVHGDERRLHDHRRGRAQRGYTGTISNYNYSNYSSTSFNGHTADGTFIDYDCGVSTYNGVTTMSGSARLSNGTTVYYYAPSSNGKQAFPTRIADAQGNYIDINYRNWKGPSISTITDTLGRTITFNYDSLDRLISVDVPKMDNTGVRTAVRIHYRQLTLNPGWAPGITTDTNNWYPYVIDAIYYPGTGTGYWFGADPLAADFSTYYSSYGMIAKVVEQRGMSWSGTAGTQGTVGAGTMSKQAVYNYDLAPNYALADAPTYTTLTESWAGMDTAPAVTGYSVFMNSSPRTITVTKPNGLKSKRYMYNAPGQWNDGLIYQDETLDASNNQLSKSEVTWSQGHYSSARPSQTLTTDEKLQTLKTTFTYGSNYNQVTSQKQYDYDGVTLLREARNTYENNAAYTNRHIFNLVKSSEVYDGAGNRVSKTDYEYDDNAVANGPWNHNLKETSGVTMHYSTYDPYTTQTQDGMCINGEWNHSECSFEGQWVLEGDLYLICTYTCSEYEQVSVYDYNTVFRGNVTKTIVYENAALPTASGPISRTKQYDVTGNLVAESASCCELKTYDYTVATQYAYPTTLTRRAFDPNSTITNSTSGTFDFYTGLVKQSTDANGRTTSTTYNTDSLRAIQTTSSTGAYSTSVYDDTAMTVTNQTHEYGGALASKTVTHLNGLGKVKREDTVGPGGVTDIVETQYTDLGEVWKKSRPYRSGDTIHWTVVTYDLLGRTTQIVDPDGSTSSASYNIASNPAQASASLGETMLTADQWGRERWTRKDALGRLVEVLEPKADGNGAFAVSGNLQTLYSYNALGQMTESNQGGQIRRFAYDSLGRMTRQKLAEQSATINDQGVWVGEGQTGATWSGSVTYDERSNITERVDARGIKTQFSYKVGGLDDPLNRLQKISYVMTPGQYDNSKPIAAVADIDYTYTAIGDRTRVATVTAGGAVTETFAYDIEGRVENYKQDLVGKTSSPLEITYSFDTLGRVAAIQYPKKYSTLGNARRIIDQTYDASSRLTSLSYNGGQQAGNISYDAAGQVTAMDVGAAGAYQINEQYTFDSLTGFLTNQKVVQGGSTTLLDLTYDYTRNNSVGSTNVNWKTGAATKILNNLDGTKDREYQYDALGRLIAAKGKASNQWQQTYAYDRYGNRTSVTAAGTGVDGLAITPDGFAGPFTYETASNRLSTGSGYQYDSAGNQTRALADDGVTWLKFEYDAANRLVAIRRDDSGAGDPLVQSFKYGAGNLRLSDYTVNGALETAYFNAGGRVLMEFSQAQGTTLVWSKSNIYAGDRLLSTVKTNGANLDYIEHHHPDKLSTRLVTDPTTGDVSEQAHLPFGTVLASESSPLLSNTKRFTSYDRSPATGLDYAQNRTYDSKQGRFMQVDPIGMKAASLLNPQSLNLYNYVGNDPINRVDPDGLFWGWLKRLFKAILKIIAFVALVAVAVVLVYFGVGLIAAGGIWNVLGGIGLFVGASIFAAKVGATVYSKIKEWVNRCSVPDYNGLSLTRQDELAQRGVTPEQWNSLRNNQKLGYFNIVAAIAAAGISLLGWIVDWARGGIQQDRTFFRAGNGATNILGQVMSSSVFRRSNGHPPNYPDGYRFNSITRSLQLSFSEDGTRFDADIDFFNPERGGAGLFGHAYEVLSHALGRVFGGRRTSPYSVGSRANWECK